jgi:hypothetical protein
MRLAGRPPFHDRYDDLNQLRRSGPLALEGVSEEFTPGSANGSSYRLSKNRWNVSEHQRGRADRSALRDHPLIQQTIPVLRRRSSKREPASHSQMLRSTVIRRCDHDDSLQRQLLDDIALQEPQCGCASAAPPMSGREHVVPDQGFSLLLITVMQEDLPDQRLVTEDPEVEHR